MSDEFLNPFLRNLRDLLNAPTRPMTTEEALDMAAAITIGKTLDDAVVRAHALHEAGA